MLWAIETVIKPILTSYYSRNLTYHLLLIMTATSAPVHLRATLDSQFSFRNEKDAAIVDLDSVHKAVYNEDWHKVSSNFCRQ